MPMKPLFRDSFPSSGAGGPPANRSPHLDYRRLTDQVRQALRQGRIPSRPADQMWGGSGSGSVCAICDLCLARHEVEYELEFSEGSGAGTYHLHVACCMAWEVELS